MELLEVLALLGVLTLPILAIVAQRRLGRILRRHRRFWHEGCSNNSVPVASRTADTTGCGVISSILASALLYWPSLSLSPEPCGVSDCD